jgi:hypothetical protein
MLVALVLKMVDRLHVPTCPRQCACRPRHLGTLHDDQAMTADCVARDNTITFTLPICIKLALLPSDALNTSTARANALF